MARDTVDVVATRPVVFRDAVCCDDRAAELARCVTFREVCTGTVARETVARLVDVLMTDRSVVLRWVVFVARETTAGVAVRDETWRDALTFVPREPVFVVARETALAAPMHIKHATKKDSAFLILNL